MRRRKLGRKPTQVIVEADGCKSLPEIEVANAEGERLKISSVSQYDHDADLVRDIV